MKKIAFVFFIALFAMCKHGMDANWLQCFYNDTDSIYSVFINHYEQGKDVGPLYNGLSSDLLERWPGALYPMKPQKNSYYTLPLGTKIERGDSMHVYVFSPDTLARYPWKEIVTRKKYWFRSVACQYLIRFPEGFEYMGE